MTISVITCFWRWPTQGARRPGDRPHINGFMTCEAFVQRMREGAGSRCVRAIAAAPPTAQPAMLEGTFDAFVLAAGWPRLADHRPRYETDFQAQIYCQGDGAFDGKNKD